MDRPPPTRLTATADVAARYERYLTCCNEHRFDQLGEFVDEQVSGSGSVEGLAAYVERLKAVGTGFPDYHWVRCWGDLNPVVRDAVTTPTHVAA